MENIKDLKVCVLYASELDISKISIDDVSDEEFCKMAEEKHSVYTLQDFVYKFNMDTIEISSANTYIRIIECK